MERIAVISDIHGNIPALEAVLQDLGRRQIARVLCLGDLVGKGPDSAGAVDRCREVCEAVVMGNWDSFICAEADMPMAEWHRQRLGPERLAYLAALPGTLEFTLSGRRVRLFHASQQGIFHRVHMYDTRESHAAMFANTPFTGDAIEPDVVGYGDIHSAYVLNLYHRVLFNVGSVGNPLDLPLAAYAILEGAYGSTAPGPFTVTIVRVPYDIERAVAEAEAAQMPDLQPYVAELRTARYRGAKPAAA
jgi:predicted phosphodiesterase